MSKDDEYTSMILFDGQGNVVFPKTVAFKIMEWTRWDNRIWPPWLKAAWQMEIGEEGALWPDIEPPYSSLNISSSMSRQGYFQVDWGDWLVPRDGGGVERAWISTEGIHDIEWDGWKHIEHSTLESVLDELRAKWLLDMRLKNA